MSCPVPKNFRKPLLFVLVAFALIALSALGVADAETLAASSAVFMVGNTQMTPGQARVVDPVLTEVARGYKNSEFVGHHLFPTVPVGQRGGQVIEFGKEDFRLYATGRAPGTNTKRVQFGYKGKPFALKQNALEGMVPQEDMDEAAAVPGIDLASVAIRSTQNIIELGKEKRQADLATDVANYGADNKLALSGTGQWSDLENSNPVLDISNGKDAVRGQIGRNPNTVVIGPQVWSKLKLNASILDRIKHTGRDVPTMALLAELFEVERVVVGNAVYMGDDGNINDVWGNFVVMSFTQTASLASQGLPSYGYTYQLRNHPIVEKPYEDRNAKSWIYPVTEESDPVIAGADAGYLLSNVVAP